MSALASCVRVAFALLLTAAAALSMPAGAADSDAGERARLAELRSAAEARFAARDKECRQRFVVSACVAEVRRERRTTLDALRARQRVLDDSRRQERATERRAALAAKAADDTRRERERAAKAGAASASAAASPASSPRQGRAFEARPEPKSAKPPRTASRPRPAASAGAAKAPSPKADPATRRQLEERSRDAFAARQKAAAVHRDEAAAAAIRRMEKHPPARSLPVPAASPARAASAP